jgi:hypothetical protein
VRDPEWSNENRLALDVGLWNDATEAAIARTLENIRRWS